MKNDHLFDAAKAVIQATTADELKNDPIDTSDAPEEATHAIVCLLTEGDSERWEVLKDPVFGAYYLNSLEGAREVLECLELADELRVFCYGILEIASGNVVE